MLFKWKSKQSLANHKKIHKYNDSLLDIKDWPNSTACHKKVMFSASNSF